MRSKRSGRTILVADQNRPKFGELLQLPEPFPFYNLSSPTDEDSSYRRSSPGAVASPRWQYNNSGNATPSSSDASPYATPPWSQSASPYTKSPWLVPSPSNTGAHVSNGLIGSIVREEGHVYSLATSGDLLYTGSESKNIRVWKNLRDFSGFKASSGLVKAIVIAGDRIFTGHTDGKIRVWRASSGDYSVYKQVGSLPSIRDCIKKSISPKNYVQVRRNRSSLWIKHYDAVSCLSLNQELGLLYSGSWDKTVKVWEIRKWTCLESIEAHDDAVNAVAAGFDSLVFTGSADGSVKVWRRELEGKGTKHFLVQVLLRQDKAVTSLAVDQEAAVVYCGSSDGLVNFWEREKHLSHGGVLRGHKQAVLCLATAGRLVLSGSADKTICVWRRGEGGVHTWLTVLRGHSGPVKCLAVEEDGDEGSGWMAYSGSLDKCVKVWRVQEKAM